MLGVGVGTMKSGGAGERVKFRLALNVMGPHQWIRAGEMLSDFGIQRGHLDSKAESPLLDSMVPTSPHLALVLPLL